MADRKRAKPVGVKKPGDEDKTIYEYAVCLDPQGALIIRRKLDEPDWEVCSAGEDPEVSRQMVRDLNVTQQGKRIRSIP